MKTVDYKQLQHQSRETLSGFGRSALVLVATHSAVTLGANLLLSILSYVLELGMAQTGGLSDLSTLALLETMQQFLQTMVSIGLPFWQMGYTFAAMQLARGQNADRVGLLTGFRHFGPVLRTNLLRIVMYFGLVMFGAQIACYVFLLTPAAKEMTAVMEQLMASLEGAQMPDYEALLENEAYLQAVQPALPFMAVGALIPLIPFLYRLRMMDFALMDDPRKGAFHAFGKSMRMTRKHCLDIFKLDLRFWWYYLLQLLTAVLCYGDVLLPLLGVELGIQADLAMFLFYSLALVCEFGLYV